MTTPVIYPDTLPAPQGLSISPQERRALAGIASVAPASARALQRDYGATAQARFVYTSAQFEAWHTWWRDTLVYGAAWFSAPAWPLPSGVAGRGGVLRYLGAPTVRHLGRGVRAVECTLEVRGRSLAPLGPIQTNYALLLNFDDSLVCEVTGETFALSGAATLETGLFTKCLDLNATAGGGGTGRCYSDAERAAWALNDGGDFQLELFFDMPNPPTSTYRALVKVGPDPNVNFVNFYLQLGNNSVPGKVIIACGAPDAGSFPRTVLSQVIDYDTAMHHVVWTGVDGVQHVGLDGVCASPAGNTYKNDRAATHLWRIGGDSVGTSSAVDARIDCVRLRRGGVDYDLASGSYTVPTGPLTL